MHKIPLIVFIIVVLMIPSQAKIGETLDQCVKRYGTPLMDNVMDAKAPFRILIFKSTGYFQKTYFLNNVEVCVRYSKEDQSELSEQEITAILDLELEKGLEWNDPLPTEDFRIIWVRSDFKGAAIYFKALRILHISSLKGRGDEPIYEAPIAGHFEQVPQFLNPSH